MIKKYGYLLCFPYSMYHGSSLVSKATVIPKVKIIGLKKLQNKRDKWILREKIKSEIAYYYLYNTPGNTMDIIDYIGDNYTNWRIYEKALLYGMWKWGKNPKNIHTIGELQSKIEKIFKKSKYIWFGNFILALHYLTMIEKNPRDNFTNISNVVRALGMDNNNKKYKKIIFYIVNYYLSEHYLFLMKEHFRLRDFNVVIVYGQKVLLRFNVHPQATMEALIILIETFLLLEGDNLVEYYTQILEDAIVLNPSLHHYKLRLKYLQQVYSQAA